MGAGDVGKLAAFEHRIGNALSNPRVHDTVNDITETRLIAINDAESGLGAMLLGPTNGVTRADQAVGEQDQGGGGCASIGVRHRSAGITEMPLEQPGAELTQE